MTLATKLVARQIFDSRGNPTVEVEVTTDDGTFRAMVPSGASTGMYEALELRDKDSKMYLGKGVSMAVQNVNSIIAPKFIEAEISVEDQTRVDEFLLALDGTPKKTRLGANSILGVSMAVSRAGAASKGVPLYKHLADLAETKTVGLPCPAFNVINGGAHASNSLVFQEFMILPTGASSFEEAMRMGTEVYHCLKHLLVQKYGFGVTVGDEGGFAPPLDEPMAVLDIINEAIDVAGYPGKVDLAMDVAASEFYTRGKYDLDHKSKDKEHRLASGEELLEIYRELKQAHPNLISIEDPFDQNDWDSWKLITKSLNLQIVGDDLTVTDLDRIQEAAEKGACNTLLLKINQIGTVTESIRASKLAKAHQWEVMVSHRSGETEDAFIADLAVGLDAGQIKAGAPCRSERLAKYNQLLRIEEELGSGAKSFRVGK